MVNYNRSPVTVGIMNMHIPNNSSSVIVTICITSVVIATVMVAIIFPVVIISSVTVIVIVIFPVTIILVVIISLMIVIVCITFTLFFVARPFTAVGPLAISSSVSSPALRVQLHNTDHR
jgi:hypothetical protein